MNIFQHNFAWENDESHQVFWEFRKRSSEEIHAEVDKILQLCPLSASAHILDVGCGIGLHVAEFGRRGYRTTGIDISDLAIERAREACDGISACTISKMRGIEIPWVEEFDLVFAIEHTLGFVDIKELHMQLKKMWAAVVAKGTFLLGIAGGTLEAWRPRYPVHKWELQNGKYILTDKSLTEDGIKKERTIIINPNSDRMDEYLEEQKYYTLKEIQNLLAKVGIKNIKVIKDLDGAPIVEAKEARYFIAKKR